MKRDIGYKMSVALIFLWLGFIGAISFMEAWLKFKAPGITLELGLGIGKLVFNALNRVEWTCMLISIVGLMASFNMKIKYRYALLYSLIAIILILQTWWLLPVLFQRANMHILGVEPGSSMIHFLYIGLEITKVFILFFLGFSLLKFQKQIPTQ